MKQVGTFLMLTCLATSLHGVTIINKQNNECVFLRQVSDSKDEETMKRKSHNLRIHLEPRRSLRIDDLKSFMIYTHNEVVSISEEFTDDDELIIQDDPTKKECTIKHRYKSKGSLINSSPRFGELVTDTIATFNYK